MMLVLFCVSLSCCFFFVCFVLVQAAWGGSVLFSKKHRHLMKGVDRYSYAYVKKMHYGEDNILLVHVQSYRVGHRLDRGQCGVYGVFVCVCVCS